MKEIEVKTKTDIFNLVWQGKKLSELRLDDDKDYCVGDVLIQKEWGPKVGYKGRRVTARISAITRLGHWVPDVDHRWVIVHLDPATVHRDRYPVKEGEWL